MLGRPDSGTSVDRVMLGAASNSMPPARTCDSISGSPPSWLLGKTVTFSRPDDCTPIACAASVSRTVRGWASGVLTPSLNSNSAAALAGLPKTVVAQAVDVAPNNPLRVIFIVRASRPHCRGLRGVSVEPPLFASGEAASACPTKPFWGTHETTLKHIRGSSVANKAAAKTLGGSHEPLNSLCGPQYPPQDRGCRARGWHRGRWFGHL